MSAHLLHVEDEPNDVFLLEMAFQQAQIRTPIRVACDGREAISILSGAAESGSCEICLVLLDLNLPDTSGFEILTWIRNQPGLKQLPVVVLTSSSHPADRERAMELGANDFIVKPVNMARMDEIIENLNHRWLGKACEEARALAP